MITQIRLHHKLKLLSHVAWALSIMLVCKLSPSSYLAQWPLNSSMSTILSLPEIDRANKCHKRDYQAPRPRDCQKAGNLDCLWFPAKRYVFHYFILLAQSSDMLNLKDLLWSLRFLHGSESVMASLSSINCDLQFPVHSNTGKNIPATLKPLS